MAKLPFTRLNLPAALYCFVALGAILFALVATDLVLDQVNDAQELALEEAVQVRTRGAALSFARSLNRDWTFLQAVSKDVPIGDHRALKTAFTVLSGSGDRIAWAGYADLGGKVLASTRGVLEGQDVSERPWFRRGLEGSFAGDIHDAVLLNSLLGGTEADPITFLDLATPVKGPDGRTAGVLAFHIQADWAQDFLTETAQSFGLDLFLINDVGEVVIATDGGAGGRLDLPSMRAAAAGVQASGFETWPDGRNYFTTVVPRIAYDTLPSFGWRLVGRIEPPAALARGSDLESTILLTLAFAGLVLLSMSVVFALFYLAPVEKLARSAERMADGHDHYPLEIQRTSELARLSAALARLQGRLG